MFASSTRWPCPIPRSSSCPRIFASQSEFIVKESRANMNKQGILPAQTRPIASAFSAGPAWEQLIGCAFGIPQSVLRGTVTAADMHPVALDALEAWMEHTLGAPLPDSTPPRGSARAVAWRAVHWSIALQRHHGVALSSAFRLKDSAGAGDSKSA